MRKLMLCGMSGVMLSLTSAALSAQDVPSAASPAPYDVSDDPALNAEQKAMYDAWTDDEKNQYLSWDPAYQVYYWSLAVPEQRGYWRLSPDQRTQIYNMTPEQRAVAWQSVVAQLQGQTPETPPTQANPPGPGMPTNTVPAPDSAAEPVPPAMPADEAYQGGPYKGALTPPPAQTKVYPVCTKTLQDSCRNPGGK